MVLLARNNRRTLKSNAASAFVINEALKRDPTRTTMLRRRMAAEGVRRWNEIKRAIRISIVDNDAFGIIAENEMTAAQEDRTYKRSRISILLPRQYAFIKDSDKVLEFEDWLDRLIDSNILQRVEAPPSSGRPAGSWYEGYIDSSYKRGVRKAWQASKRVASEQGQQGQALEMFDSLGFPVHVDRLEGLFTRVFSELDTVKRIQENHLRRVFEETLRAGLPRGLAEGKSPRAIVRDLVKELWGEVDAIGIHRIKMIARTEILRAYHEGNIAMYEQAENMIGKPFEFRLVLAIDACPVCKNLKRHEPYTIHEMYRLLPAHPNCRCAFTGDPAAQEIVEHVEVINLEPTKLREQPEFVPFTELEEALAELEKLGVAESAYAGLVWPKEFADEHGVLSTDDPRWMDPRANPFPKVEGDNTWLGRWYYHVKNLGSGKQGDKELALRQANAVLREWRRLIKEWNGNAPAKASHLLLGLHSPNSRTGLMGMAVSRDFELQAQHDILYDIRSKLAYQFRKKDPRFDKSELTRQFAPLILDIRDRIERGEEVEDYEQQAVWLHELWRVVHDDSLRRQSSLYLYSNGTDEGGGKKIKDTHRFAQEQEDAGRRKLGWPRVLVTPPNVYFDDEDTIETTFRHEYAHAIHADLIPKHEEGDDLLLSSRWVEVLRAALDGTDYGKRDKVRPFWTAGGKGDNTGGVSKYAGKNAEETFAEIFTQYSSRFYVRGSLPPPVETFFDDLWIMLREGVSRDGIAEYMTRTEMKLDEVLSRFGKTQATVKIPETKPALVGTPGRVAAVSFDDLANIKEAIQWAQDRGLAANVFIPERSFGVGDAGHPSILDPKLNPFAESFEDDTWVGRLAYHTRNFGDIVLPAARRALPELNALLSEWERMRAEWNKRVPFTLRTLGIGLPAPEKNQIVSSFTLTGAFEREAMEREWVSWHKETLATLRRERGHPRLQLTVELVEEIRAKQQRGEVLTRGEQLAIWLWDARDVVVLNKRINKKSSMFIYDTWDKVKASIQRREAIEHEAGATQNSQWLERIGRPNRPAPLSVYYDNENMLHTIFRAEYGHVVNALDGAAAPLSQSRRFIAAVARATAIGWSAKKDLSQIAGANANELFAQLFTFYSSRFYVRGSLPRSIEGMFDDLWVLLAHGVSPRDIAAFFSNRTLTAENFMRRQAQRRSTGETRRAA